MKWQMLERINDESLLVLLMREPASIGVEEVS